MNRADSTLATGATQNRWMVAARGAILGLGLAMVLSTLTLSGSRADEKVADKKVERTYEGDSKDGKVQEALDNALVKLDKDLPEGGVADASASWKLAEVSGQRGGLPGFRSVKVKITATRTPDWKK
jgi:hypothetical protein